jgi:hypothetical protein
MRWSCVASGSLDGPVAIRPDLARAVLFISVGVGIAGQVEPVPAPTLTVMRRSEEPVDNLVVRVVAGVFDECIDFFWRWGKTGKIEAQPPNESDAISFRRGGKSLCFQPCEDEVINRVARPGRVGHKRQVGSLRLDVCPVDLLLAALDACFIRPVRSMVDPGS